MSKATRYGPFHSDDAESNVVAYRQPKPPDHAAFRAEVSRYFTRRLKRLKIAKTTTTPRGQTIDWIPVDSQVARGRIAAPPADVPGRKPRRGRNEGRPAIPELENAACERGPAGTVPILRKKLDALGFTTPLRPYLSKYRGLEVLDHRGLDILVPDPTSRGTHWVSAVGQDLVCFGSQAQFSCFDPYTDSSEQFSLIQTRLLNDESGVRQTVEAGWQEYQGITGDWIPHLFVYYTSNGYRWDDDNQGGYNTDVDGWVQVDDVIFPGSTFTPLSAVGGDQREIDIQYRLFNDNWWLGCQGRWVGYYPKHLFMGNGSTFDNLADHAQRVEFYGEVASFDAAVTPTDMGSGRFADEGWTNAAYIKNMRVQTDRAGAMDNLRLSRVKVSDTSLYTIDVHVPGDGSWGSFIFVGGPGAG